MLKLVFHGFVVLVGVLILAGAQNTSIVGANGVLEPGGGRRRAHRLRSRSRTRRYGTSYRIINLIVGMQLLTIILSRGNVLRSGRPVRLRRDLELCPEVAGGAGAALHRAREPRNGKCPAIFTLAGAKYRWA